ncbi:MAG TPA: hypothetical protein VHO50_01235 [Bacteroidales bacterium]|nr:hypothetical protein [Bacteroidales bacterium]
MGNLKLLQSIADISYIAGNEQHYSGNSRADVDSYISWAIEFEKIHKNTDWDCNNYMLLIEEFAYQKLCESKELSTIDGFSN